MNTCRAPIYQYNEKTKTYTVEMSEEDVRNLGIVFCSSCGYPPNNHFDFGKRKCAHDPKCTGYKPEILLPT